MLTDDPGIVDQSHFEINISINTELNQIDHLETPLIDINYGLSSIIQLKFEMPYEYSNETRSNLTGSIGAPNVGLKYQFHKTDSNSISMSFYPQITIATHPNEMNEYKIPLQFEKSMGKFLAGNETGYYYVKNNSFFFDGLITGFKWSPKFETMAEIYFLARSSHFQLSNTKVNLGMRLELGRKIIALCSFGTDIQNKYKEDRVRFFSFTGIQWLL